MRSLIELATHERETLVDVTDRVRSVVAESGVQDGLCCVYAHGATAAIMIQENWDASVPTVDDLSTIWPFAAPSSHPASGFTTARTTTATPTSKPE